MLKNLSSVSNVWSSEPYFPNFKNYMKELLSDIKEKLGWNPKEEEPTTIALLRSSVLSILGKFGILFFDLILFINFFKF